MVICKSLNEELVHPHQTWKLPYWFYRTKHFTALCQKRTAVTRKWMQSVIPTAPWGSGSIQPSYAAALIADACRREHTRWLWYSHTIEPEGGCFTQNIRLRLTFSPGPHRHWNTHLEPPDCGESISPSSNYTESFCIAFPLQYLMWDWQENLIKPRYCLCHGHNLQSRASTSSNSNFSVTLHIAHWLFVRKLS